MGQPKNLVFTVMDSCRFDSYQRAKTLSMDGTPGSATKDESFDQPQVSESHAQQVRCVEEVNQTLAELTAKARSDRHFPDAHFIVTADHAECFGEGNCFVHGPTVHEKVMQMPFFEGCRPHWH